MKLFEIKADKVHQIELYGSQNFALTHLAAGEARLSWATLEAGGRIGRHPASVQQLLLVVEGLGEVSGGDGAFRPIRAGQAVLWEYGEEHETRTESGMTLILFEGSLKKIGDQLQPI